MNGTVSAVNSWLIFYVYIPRVRYKKDKKKWKKRNVRNNVMPEKEAIYESLKEK